MAPNAPLPISTLQRPAAMLHKSDGIAGSERNEVAQLSNKKLRRKILAGAFMLDTSFQSTPRESAQCRMPDDSPTEETAEVQQTSNMFQSIMLDEGEDWSLLNARKVHQQEDREYVRDCPADQRYEVDRLRYIYANGEIPVNKKERIMQLMRQTPDYVRIGANLAGEVARNAPELLSAGVNLASEVAETARASVVEAYGVGGASAVVVGAVATTAFVAKDIAGAAITGTKVVVCAAASAAQDAARRYFNPSLYDDIGVPTRLRRRQSGTGEVDLLPTRDEIALGRRRVKLRDLAVVEEGLDGGSDGEMWEEDSDMEELVANARARKKFGEEDIGQI